MLYYLTRIRKQSRKDTKRTYVGKNFNQDLYQRLIRHEARFRVSSAEHGLQRRHHDQKKNICLREKSPRQCREVEQIFS